MSLRIGVDIGGTFTDIVAVDGRTGHAVFVKTPSTHGRQAEGVVRGVKEALNRGHWTPSIVSYFAHGTTVATNAILERKGARTALLVTRGFRDLLSIGRQTRPHLYDARARRPQPLVPRFLTFEIDERLAADGAVLEPLDLSAMESILEALKTHGAESVAVTLLHSYADASHERAVREHLRRIWPEVRVSLSSEVLPQPGEFERASTTVMNAYVMPAIDTYLNSLSHDLRELGVDVQVNVMQSSGGVMTAETAAHEKSVHSCLSGPAAGVIGANWFAAKAGYKNVIAVDMGGTSFDVSLVLNGEATTRFEGTIGGYPVRVPMYDIVTLGAGGGSLCQVSRGRALRVGPESAGSLPGPACYGRGGDRPTVTDANAVLGRLRGGRILGGSIVVDRDRAWKAVEEYVARPLEIGPIEAAYGICRVVNATMISGIRVMTVERGHDPRRFALLAFGGSGPVHAVELAEELGIPTVIVPPTPGLCCAVGLLLADYQYDYVTPLDLLVDRLDEASLGAIAGQLRHMAETQAHRERLSPASLRLVFSLDLCYAGQGHALNVPWDGKSIQSSLAAFNAAHRRLYGYERPHRPVEAVAARLRAIAPVPPVMPVPPAAENVDPRRAMIARSEVAVGGGMRSVAVYDRERLGAGARLTGPAIVEQEDTTVYLGAHPASIDSYGNLIIDTVSITETV